MRMLQVVTFILFYFILFHFQANWKEVCKSCALDGGDEDYIGKRSLDECKKECIFMGNCTAIEHNSEGSFCWLQYCIDCIEVSNDAEWSSHKLQQRGIK